MHLVRHMKSSTVAEVAPQSNFICGPLELNSWVDHN